MEKYEQIFNICVATIGALITWLFGGWDIAVVVLVMFLVLDYATGLIRAWINKELSSDIGFRGITRKLTIFVLLIVAVALDRMMNSGTWVFRTLVCYYFISNEGLSLIENCAALGVPIPQKLQDALEQLKEGNKKDYTKKEEV